MSIDLIALRHELHRHPEVSGFEAQTAGRIARQLRELSPDHLIEGLGGHGIAAVFEGPKSGPTVLLRCELDALPIVERAAVPYRSQRLGVAHLCGHDGHMAIMVGVAERLTLEPPRAGRVVLLFQPAEETGAGARAVIADQRFQAIKPDYAFAIHNMPTMAVGEYAITDGLMNCASCGVDILLAGREAHAATPETGASPAALIGELIAYFSEFNRGECAADVGFSRATVTHIQMGMPTFGIAPGQARLCVTLRTSSTDALNIALADVMRMITLRAQQHGLETEISTSDRFDAVLNDAEAVALIDASAKQVGLQMGEFELPMRASEDFGTFSGYAKTALILLGAGKAHPMIHDPMYDFPDALIPKGVALFSHVIEQLNGLKLVQPH
ncbi:MAG: amidohydrolase [Gammaproteobacteria bacterium]|nr:amidohydrolase [Gammaproteobacteria bacterium]